VLSDLSALNIIARDNGSNIRSRGCAGQARPSSGCPNVTLPIRTTRVYCS